MSVLQESANKELSPLINKMSLEKIDRQAGKIFFTGWKEFPKNPGWFEGENEFIGDGTAVGQIVYWFPQTEGEKMKFAYVNLPGFQNGVREAGSCFDCGEERIDLANRPTMEEVEAMLNKGLGIIHSLIDKEEGL